MNNIEKKEKEAKTISQEYHRIILLFLRFSGWIVGPVIVALIIGKIIDGRYESDPWATLIAIGVAFIFSMIGIVKETLKEYKKIVKDIDKK
ncbi:MAG: hypothetical protein U9P61_01400 [Patescibacteria group bacterium]|nr:hypothetical protein [Patescibacteria group bacterium]